jgi:hypothetical protein
VEKYFKTERPHVTTYLIWSIHVTFWISKDTATPKICNTYCFYMAIMVTERYLSIKLHIYKNIAWLVSNTHSKVIKSDKFSININSSPPTATDKRSSHFRSNSVLHCGTAEVTEGHFSRIAKKNANKFE